ncbi:MAG: DUF885 family protein, partial [Deltaproteobacteria bacterium]|nr:DUF885 family protein [Deltaproteobacteria bacterium]
MSIAAGRTSDPALRSLLEDHWDGLMWRAPTWATALGDHRYDDRLPDASLAVAEEWRNAERELLGRLGRIPNLPEADQLTADLLTFELSGDLRLGDCAFETWDFSARDNPLTRLADIAEHHPTATPADLDNLATRYRAAPAWIDQQTANLRVGLGSGRAVSAPTVRLALDQLDAYLAVQDAEWPLAATLREADRPLLAPIRAALVRWRAFLADELLPGARPADREGLWALPGGAACYA